MGADVSPSQSALETLEKDISKLPPNMALKVWSEAKLALMKGDISEAKIKVARCLARHPSDGPCHGLAARINLMKKEPAMAIKHLKKALALRSSAENWCNLGTAYLQLGNEKKARWAYRHAGRIDPENPTVIYNMKNLGMDVD